MPTADDINDWVGAFVSLGNTIATFDPNDPKAIAAIVATVAAVNSVILPAIQNMPGMKTFADLLGYGSLIDVIRLWKPTGSTFNAV